MSGTEMQNKVAQLERAAIGATSAADLAGEARRLGIEIPPGMIEKILNQLDNEGQAIPEEERLSVVEAAIKAAEAKAKAGVKTDGVTRDATELPTAASTAEISAERAEEKKRETEGIV